MSRDPTDLILENLTAVRDAFLVHRKSSDPEEAAGAAVIDVFGDEAGRDLVARLTQRSPGSAPASGQEFWSVLIDELEGYRAWESEAGMPEAEERPWFRQMRYVLLLGSLLLVLVILTASLVSSPEPTPVDAVAPLTTPLRTAISEPGPTLRGVQREAPVETEEPSPAETPPPPTPAPTETPQPPPTPVTFSGSGKSVTDSFPIEGGITIVEMSHNGSENFIIWLLDGVTGDEHELLVNDIGSYHGTRLFGLPEGSFVLDVSADGPWQVEVRQPRPATGDALGSVQGSGDTAVGPIAIDGGLTRFKMSHTGAENFVIWLYDDRGDAVALLANEIGSWSGEKAEGLSGGIYWMDVVADGTWTIGID